MIRALIFATVALTAPLASAQTQTESAAAHHGVPVQEIVSPAGIHAWLVSDSTVPIIAIRAYWRGSSAIEPERLAGVTGVMTDMLTEGSGDLDGNAFKERMEELNISLGFGAGWDGVSFSLTTLTENRDAAIEMAAKAGK